MHVLVVDAERPSQNLVKILLRPFQATVTRVQGSPEALALVQQLPYDLIILDVDLPGPGGLDIIRKVHADPTLGRVPILAATFADRGAEILRAGC